MQKKPTRGGKRPGAGSKGKYTCETKMISLRVPVDAIPAIKELAKIEAAKYLIVHGT